MLPAHRFHDRATASEGTEERGKKKGKGKVWVLDYDETITAAPKHLKRITRALKKMGDSIYVLTGNDSPRKDLLKQLDDFGIKYDDLFQYTDSQTDGLARLAYLKQLKAWGAFDNRVDRSPIYIEQCPHFFVVSAPTKPAKKAAKKAGAKKDAKKDVQKQGRSVTAPLPQPIGDDDESN